jgi:hypothetical protein
MSKKVYPGKPAISLGFDPANPDPEQITRAIVGHREQSVIAAVGTHMAASVGASAVRNDKAKETDLYRLPVGAKFLSQEDIKIGGAGENRLKMANKICKHQDVILDHRILPYLEPAYSVLYQLVSLYEDLQAAETTGELANV